jgi:hypothetical protein
MMKKLSPIEQSSKLKVLQECMDSMDEMMGGDLDSKKKMKATVIASDKKGLKEGLEKAEDVVSGDEMIAEMDEEDEEVEEELSPEEIQAKIEELEALLAMKSKKSDVKFPF